MPADSEYNHIREMQFQLGDQIVQVCTKPGIPNWDRLSPSATLLADYLEPSGVHKLMLFGCGQGAPVVYLAQKLSRGLVRAYDIYFLSYQLTEKTILANGYRASGMQQVEKIFSKTGAADIQLGTSMQNFSSIDDACDTIAIILPKGRQLIRRWLLGAYHALPAGGCLYLTGAGDEGIQPAIKDAYEIFGNSTILGYRKGCRVTR